MSAGWLDGATSYTYPPVCSAPGFPGTCPDADPATEWSFLAYKPVQSFVAALPDILAAEQTPQLGSDGLRYALAGEAGSL